MNTVGEEVHDGMRETTSFLEHCKQCREDVAAYHRFHNATRISQRHPPHSRSRHAGSAHFQMASTEIASLRMLLVRTTLVRLHRRFEELTRQLTFKYPIEFCTHACQSCDSNGFPSRARLLIKTQVRKTPARLFVDNLNLPGSAKPSRTISTS